ncbi:hypothetical protein NC651_011394 [Populus alba x Populus x berolinensis]|nr:hypothetical protein NC651_011394 [Populus alba x Populus x berolinensis]
MFIRGDSIKALHRERGMLSKMMNKRFSEEERNRLYKKWGIGLSSKRRRLQLANRIWSNTEDIDHVTESAAVVAKLVRFVEQGQALKEMFGLSFTPPTSSARRRVGRILEFRKFLMDVVLQFTLQGLISRPSACLTFDSPHSFCSEKRRNLWRREREMSVAAATAAGYLGRRAAQKERVRILYRRALKDTLNWAVHRHLFYEDADLLRARFETSKHVVRWKLECLGLCLTS